MQLLLHLAPSSGRCEAEGDPQELDLTSHLRFRGFLTQLLVFWGLYLPILGTNRVVKIVFLLH